MFFRPLTFKPWHPHTNAFYFIWPSLQSREKYYIENYMLLLNTMSILSSYIFEPSRILELPFLLLYHVDRFSWHWQVLFCSSPIGLIFDYYWWIFQIFYEYEKQINSMRPVLNFRKINKRIMIKIWKDLTDCKYTSWIFNFVSIGLIWSPDVRMVVWITSFDWASFIR